MKSKMIIAFLKRTVLVTMLLVFGLSTATAQHKKRPHFDPKRFEAELEQFITTNACLTPGESAKIFPRLSTDDEASAYDIRRDAPFASHRYS